MIFGNTIIVSNPYHQIRPIIQFVLTYFVELENVEMYGAELLMQLSKLTVMPANKLTAYADAVVGSLPLLLDQGVPRKILMLCSKIWMKLNSIIPRQYVAFYPLTPCR